MLSLALSAAWLGICIFYMVKDHEAYSSTIEYRGHSYIYFYNHGTSAATHDPDFARREAEELLDKLNEK